LNTSGSYGLINSGFLTLVIVLEVVDVEQVGVATSDVHGQVEPKLEHAQLLDFVVVVIIIII
jgi:hypothetical protein